MDVEAMDLLIQFFAQTDIFMLVFVRVLAFILVLPIVASMNIPMMTRVFLALVVSVAVFLSGLVTTVYYVDSTAGYVFLVIQEFLAGMAMGYVVFSVFNLIFFVGQIIDFQIGLMLVNVMDPMTQIQVPIMGNLYYLALMGMLVASGGLHQLFGVFFQSYVVLPIGTAMVLGNEALAWGFVMLLVESTVIAVRISLPILGAMLVVNAALGIMVKTVPQMNIFVVGLPIKLLVGLILIYAVMTPALYTMFRLVYDLAFRGLIEVILGMSP